MRADGGLDLLQTEQPGRDVSGSRDDEVLSLDDVSKQGSFSAKHGFDYPLLADVGGAVATAYGVKRSGLMAKVTPVKRATFVIGADGLVKEVIASETRMNTHADTALEVLARG